MPQPNRRPDHRRSPTGNVALELLRRAGLGAASGLLAGLACWAFLTVLDQATELRLQHGWLLGLLPLAGLAVGVSYHFLGGEAGRGNALLIEQIHEPTAWVPRRMAPLVAVGTVVSHLFGASVGREGTALQMSGSLTDLFARSLRLDHRDRRWLLIAALAGGFSATFGVPWAGAVFAVEVQSVRHRGRHRFRRTTDRYRARRGGAVIVPVDPQQDDTGGGVSERRAGGAAGARAPRHLLQAVGRNRFGADKGPRLVAAIGLAVPVLAAAAVGDRVVLALGRGHDRYPQLQLPLTGGALGRVALLGVGLGLAAVAFVEATDLVHHAARHIRWAPARPVVGR